MLGGIVPLSRVGLGARPSEDEELSESVGQTEVRPFSYSTIYTEEIQSGNRITVQWEKRRRVV